MSTARIFVLSVVTVLAFLGDARESHAPGIVLLQRQVEAVEGDAYLRNSTVSHEEMFDALGEMKAMDVQLQRKAREQSGHLASMVAEYDAKLKAEKENIAVIARTNYELRKKIEEQQSKNNGMRSKLNATKQQVEHVARDFQAFAASLSDTGSDLDVVLSEDVELKPPRELLSALQIEDEAHPDDQMKHLKSSLENIHSQVEADLTEKFNTTYNGLLAHEMKITQDQERLNISLAFERRQGLALQKQINRLEKLMGEMAEKRSIVQSSVATIGDVVTQSKLKSARRAEKLLAKAMEANVSTRNVSEVGKHSVSTHKVDEKTPGLFGRAVQASKAALASAGKKVASVFGRGKPKESSTQEMSSGGNSSASSSTSHAKVHGNTTHSENKGHTTAVPKKVASSSKKVASSGKSLSSNVSAKK
eukprot:TRINITY_DN380_c0_g1_i2.p1 TRINITY_DN380_c0_g1~~TRINITY_DN380_c0_g1_i2.p1  ORF type:complete len:419 (+),score=103.87 TRINITY_DN380_c0_g1_i2:85-1341(+)